MCKRKFYVLNITGKMRDNMLLWFVCVERKNNKDIVETRVESRTRKSVKG